MKKFKKEKKSLNVFNKLKTLILPKEPSSIEERRANHTPSWMYRNE